MAMRVSRDPRRELGTDDVRPLVATPPAGLPVWVIALGAAVLAVLLFVLLDGRRRSLTAPPVKARYDDGASAARPMPSLYIPPIPAPSSTPIPVAQDTPSPALKRAPLVAPPPPQIVYVPQPAPAVPPFQSPPHAANAPVLIVDTGAGPATLVATDGGSTAPADGVASAPAGVRATLMRHRSTTVGQGTVIPAVLESALDSTRAGVVRAIVSRDIRGFDGARVLIQRGSRLFGDYRADLQPGQNRALVTWTRLVRPDGATIALVSPAADPLGRAGIRGKVNSHFLQRFASAILQSALDVGVNLASRAESSNSAVVVALPSTGQTLSQPLTQSAQIQPSLRVRQGTAINVFVARDLDFTAIETSK